MKPQLIFKKIDLAQTPPLMSALGQKPDMATRWRNVRLTPKAGTLPAVVHRGAAKNGNGECGVLRRKAATG